MEESGFPVRTAAITAGVGILLMAVSAPFAELYALPKLIGASAAVTYENLRANQLLFVQGLFAYLLTFALDIIVAWALYYFFAPAGRGLSLLAAGLRFTYAVVSIVALLNLVNVFRIVDAGQGFGLPLDVQIQQVALGLQLFRAQWYFGILFFGVHLLLTGYLAVRAKYTPTILGLILMVSGAGYMLTALRPYFYSTVRIDFAAYTFVGELIFMIWLLAMGWRIREQGTRSVN